MIKKTRHYQTRLAVIGAGVAGCAATIFALNRGINSIQIGNTGALAYTSGYLDLLGVNAAEYISDPWQALNQLRSEQPDHPYCRVDNAEISAAFDEFIDALRQMGLNYTAAQNSNLMALLPAGSCKPTFSIPETMQQSLNAINDRARVLIIDFAGLQGFSGPEIVANLSTQWPGLRSQHVSFPDMESGAQVYAEVMARALEVPETRVALAERIKPLLGDAEYLALPAILGIHHPDLVHQDMQRLIGLPVFEIPCIPPAVPGIRLRELTEQQLSAKGATVISQKKVESVVFKEQCIQLAYEDHFGPVVIEAENVLLASGRFLSGGLEADQFQVYEPLMQLPVQQPDSREDWFREDYFDLRGHAVNRAGLLVNDRMQVVDAQQQLVDRRLFAAGIVLANQDWVRQRCGAGVAIATAYKAVNSIHQAV